MIDGDDDLRPKLHLSTHESEVVGKAIDILADECDSIYQRAGRLAAIIKDDRPLHGFLRGGSPFRIVDLPSPRLREIITQKIRCLSYRAPTNARPAEWADAHPPEWLVKEAMARAEWPRIRHLEKIIETPVMRPDGTIITQPGYDAATGLYYAPDVDFGPIPERPTIDDAKRAFAELNEIVADFPFLRAEHRAAYHAGLLTPFAMYTYDGPAPLMVVDANTRGSGKSKLADTVGELFNGRAMPRMANPRSDEEMEKRITCLALTGESQVLIDNVEGSLGSASLNAALTGTTWRGRILGRSEYTDLPLRICWWATGNNTVLDGDTVRRVLHVRLESPMEKPEERRNFKHPDLLGWVHHERRRLVRAALVVLRAWFAAGKPDMGLTPWGSYEAWSSVVRNVLVWLDQPDPAITRVELAKESDGEAGALRTLMDGIDAIGRTSGVTAGEMIKLSANGNDHEGLREAIAELCPTRDGKTPSPKSLGRRLLHLRRRVIGDRYVDKADVETRNGTLWIVRRTEQ